MSRRAMMGGHSYAYDGEGRRIAQTVSGVITKYLLDVQPGLAQVIAATTGASTTRYIHDIGGIQAMENSSGVWSWMLNDGQGSVRLVMPSGTGTVPTETRQYALYGTRSQLLGSPQTEYGYTGEPLDDNGLIHLRARYYSPALGVFASLDPLEGIVGRPMSLNGYGWVEGNTPNKIDPSGTIPEDNDQYRYTCKCGWLDSSHMGPGFVAARRLAAALTAPVNYRSLGAIDGVRVIEPPKRPVKVAHPFLVGFYAYVPDSIIPVSEQEALSTVGLGIYMRYEQIFERMQATWNFAANILGRPSGFSEEDLPSDLIGYWLGVRNSTPPASWFDSIGHGPTSLCEILGADQGRDREYTSAIYREYIENGLEYAFATDWANWSRRPRPDHVALPSGSSCSSEEWPSELSQFTSSAVVQSGLVDVFWQITWRGVHTLPRDGWYELHGATPLQSVPGVEGLYVIPSALAGC